MNFKNCTKTIGTLLLIFLLGVSSYAQTGKPSKGPSKGKVFTKDFSNAKKITTTISTHEGEMVLELFFDKAPNTVANYISLAESEFYNGLIFHRVVQGFMTQGGCPKGDGTGDPGYTIDDEKNDLTHEAGTLAMANSGPNTGGSQFYVTHMPQPHLNNRHTVFGKILEGFDVLTRIERGDVIKSVKINITQK